MLSLDGASQAQIDVQARDANGQPARNINLRAEIQAAGQIIDCGNLSARTRVTNGEGRTSFIYTAPTFPCDQNGLVTIRITPFGTDASNAVARTVDIRLVQPGVILPGGPTPSFTVNGSATLSSVSPFVDVTFDASNSTPAPGTGIASYSWNFGDGTTTGGQIAVHRFSPGQYSVRLTVTDTNGRSAVSVRTLTVGAGAGPTAAFVFSPEAPGINQPIVFNGSQSTAPPGRTIVRYDWNFGSGSPQSGMTVTKSYDVPGTYNVVLTVTDDVGQTDTESNTVTVSAGTTQAPVAAFNFSPTQPTINQPVFFNGGASTGGVGTITNYAWDFGDGGFSNTNAGPTTSHPYTAAGTYVVRLTITNSANQTATTTSSVIVNATGTVLSADFSFSPTDPNSGQLVTFNASASSPLSSIVSYDWDFGDGVVLNGQTGFLAQHTYFTPTGNTYVVRLTVRDNLNRTATTTRSVTVGNGGDPIASFTVSPSPATAGAIVTFDGASSTPPASIVRYEWLFGDGSPLVSTTAPTTSITHSYSAPGTYVIRLTVVDSSGRSGSTTRTLVVQ
jgi:PKD repeat protein